MAGTQTRTDTDPCAEAALDAGLTEAHAESCEGRRHRCPGCPFDDGALREGHREDCRGRGLTDEQEAEEWEAFRRDYEAWIDGDL